MTARNRWINLDKIFKLVDNAKQSDECLVFHYGSRGNSRPVIRIDGRLFLIARLVLARKLGKDIKDLEQACHKCDNIFCINENHLWEGTQRDNLLDAIRKGRR